ncbi:MAG: DUF1540 domain-containing protein [Lachnospiraceae bacterium]|jgi:hypothetical protein|nr:DUF1540 domain-containing protein [Lachnospiraceae bacterium]
MTKLECSVKSCAYNEEPYCCKGDITVGGSEAKNTSETCCSSFQEKTRDCACNSVGQKSEDIEINCKAEKCVHNENCKCDANRIGIVGGVAKECKDTQCASFCCQ